MLLAGARHYDVVLDGHVLALLLALLRKLFFIVAYGMRLRAGRGRPTAQCFAGQSRLDPRSEVRGPQRATRLRSCHPTYPCKADLRRISVSMLSPSSELSFCSGPVDGARVGNYAAPLVVASPPAINVLTSVLTQQLTMALD